MFYELRAHKLRLGVRRYRTIIIAVLLSICFTVVSLLITLHPVRAAVINISGNIYEDATVSALLACDGVTAMVGLAVNGVVATPVSCDDSTGGFFFSGITVNTGDVVVLWIDGLSCAGNNLTGSCATSVIRSSAAGNITDAVLRRNQLIVRHDDAGPITNANLNTHDNSNDPDIIYNVAGTALTVEDQVKLHLNANSTYTPGGTITMSPSNNSAGNDGDVVIDSGATLNMASSTLTVGGDYLNNGTFAKSVGQEIIFTATTAGHTISGTMTGSSEFSRFTTNANGGWTTTGPVLVSNPNATNTVTISGGTLTIGDSDGDNFETRGRMSIAATSGQNAIVQTAALPQGQSITIDINANVASPSCANCSILVGATSGAGSGRLLLRKNTVLRLNPRAAAVASDTALTVRSTGYLEVLGSLDYSSISDGLTSETELTDTTQTWSSGENVGKQLRMVNGLARGRVYPIIASSATTLTRPDNSSSDFTIVSLTGLPVSGEIRRLCADSSALVSRDGEHSSRYIHDKTGSTGYFKIVKVINDDEDCSGNDSFWLRDTPSSFNILAVSDLAEISDGLVQGDAYEIIDAAHITAESGTACTSTVNEAGEARVVGETGSETLMRYADICNLGRSAFSGLSFSPGDDTVANQGLRVDKSVIHGNYTGLFLSSSSNTTISDNFIHDVANRCLDLAFSSNFLSVSGNRTEGCPINGIKIYQSSGSVIENNIFSEVGRAFFTSDANLDLALSTNITIRNNEFSDAYNHMYMYTDNNNIDIYNNDFYDAGYAAMRSFANSSDVDLTNNRFYAAGYVEVQTGTGSEFSNNLVVMGYAVRMWSGANFTASDNTFIGGSSSLNFNAPSGSLNVTNNYFSGVANAGLLIDNNTSATCDISGNDFVNHDSSSAITFGYSTAPCTVEQNNIEGTSYAAMEIYKSRNITYTNNVITNAKGSGIAIVNSYSSTIENNIITRSRGSGIYAENSSSGNLIYNNQISDSGQYGIYFAYASGIEIRNNVMHGNGIAGIAYSAHTANNISINNNIYANNYGIIDSGNGNISVNEVFGNPTANSIADLTKAASGFPPTAPLKVYNPTYSSHSFWTNKSAQYILPAGKIHSDIVGMVYDHANMGRLCAFYLDSTYSCSINDFDFNQTPVDIVAEIHNYTLPLGKTPADVVGSVLEGNNSDRLVMFFNDGTYASATDNEWHAYDDIDLPEVHNYTLPAGKTPTDIVEIEQDVFNNGILAVFYSDGTYSTATDDSWDAGEDVSVPNLHSYAVLSGKTPADIAGISSESWYEGKLAVWYTDGSYSYSETDWDVLVRPDVSVPQQVTSGGIVISQPNGATGEIVIVGTVSLPLDDSVTPQSENVLAMNFSDPLRKISVLGAQYNGTGTQDTDLEFDASAADASAGPYVYRIHNRISGNCGVAVFDVIRDGNDIGDAACGSEFVDTNGFRFKIDGGDIAGYSVGDAYIFTLIGGTNDSNVQKILRFGQDESSLIVGNGTRLELKGTGVAPTAISRTNTGGYSIEIGNGGTIDADEFTFDYSGGTSQAAGLVLLDGSTIVSFQNGSFNNYAVNDGTDSYIQVDSSLIGSSTPSRTFQNIAFNNNTGHADCNINAVGMDTMGYWYFNPSNGNFAGESYDCNDGAADTTVGQLGWLMIPESSPIPPPPALSPTVQSGSPVIAQRRPRRPTILSPKQNDTLISEFVTVTGTGDPGARIVVYDGQLSVGSVFVPPSGNWAVSYSADKPHYQIYAISCIENLCSQKTEVLSISVDLAANQPVVTIQLTKTEYETEPKKPISIELRIVNAQPPYKILFTWGDGSSEEFTNIDDSTMTFRHIYDTEGNFSGKILSYYADGREITSQFSVSVREKPKIQISNQTVLSLKKFILKIPRFVLFAIPYLLLLLLLLLLWMLIDQSKREMLEIKALGERLKRMKVLAKEKDNFISLGSHYLRTPLTLITGAVELAQSILPENAKTKLAPMSNKIQQLIIKTEEIITSSLDATYLSDIVAPTSAKRQQLSATFNIFFIFPIVAALAILVLLNILIFSIADLDTHFVNFLTQLAIFAIIAVLFYKTLRNLENRQRVKSAMARLLEFERLLDSARNLYVSKSLENMQPEINGIISQIHLLDEQSHRIISRGIEQYQTMFAKFTILKNLSAEKANKTQVNTGQIIKTAIEASKATAALRSVSLSHKGTIGVLPLTVDPVLLDWVIKELINNAIKFADEGSMVSIVTSVNKGIFCFSVNDMGAVIDDEKINYLFKPFSRGESVETFTYEGMGFGLYLAKMIINQSGGDLRLTTHRNNITEARLEVSVAY